MQETIKHLKALNALHQSAQEAAEPPTKDLAEVLKVRIVSALKLK